jgi:flagellar basal body-associated protein FliL
MEKMNHEDMGMGMKGGNSTGLIIGAVIVVLIVGAVSYASGMKSGEKKAMMAQDAMMQGDMMKKDGDKMMNNDTMMPKDAMMQDGGMKMEGDTMMKQ